MSRQPLTAYLLGPRVTSLETATPAVREIGDEVPLEEGLGFRGRLFLAATPPLSPRWGDFLQGVVGRELVLPSIAAVRALLLVEATENEQTRVVAFTFGTAGQYFLQRSWLEHGFGLRCALNACFPRGAPETAVASLRSIDSKAFDEVALDTRQLASRHVGFEVFGMNIQTDLLRAVVGIPQAANLWGARVRGRDSFVFSIEPERSLATVAGSLIKLYQADDYQRLFPWVDNIKPVRNDALLQRLEVACMEAVKAARLDLVGPEELDLGHVTYYRVRGDVRSNKRFFLDLRNYVTHVGRENITINRLKSDWIKAYDDDDRVVDTKAIFECLAGDLTLDGSTYVLADGEFYAVDRDFIRRLDRDINTLANYTGLPQGQLGEKEEDYNARAAADPDLLLLDQRNITLAGRTTPVEPCDLLSRTGAFIHIKRHVRSSTLSHLFSQGAVAGELLVTSSDFRRELRDLIATVETERRAADPKYDPGLCDLITDDPPARQAHEVVFAIIARWGNRSPAKVLPFFSKLNLRQRATELERLGFKVSIGKINYN